ncbi:hypothetical protein LptCag_2653 [Leptospirillum ferriphilum]|jgi:hypothetical protein|uniref:Phosphatidylglycerol lysyltransferase C-terminal domain-containing protein n=1 Tax=Leptospirillum ferriphilum TaxID=178606 RepID=A0A094X9J1_9BACT|nr:hypothetical protein [Leptospirillum ferriphilum]KGA95219.1 hypothetical protein LptCag_2653 [Leptospirillum ferriphilum]
MGSPVHFQPLKTDSIFLRERMGSLLPDSLLPALSYAHPLSLLLFDRGLTYLEGTWKGNLFLAVESAGYTFLPSPPRWTLLPEGPSGRTLGEPSFWRSVSETLLERNNGIPSHLDGIPDASKLEGFPAPELTETEFLLCASDWKTLSGPRHKTHRWERNRLSKFVPDVRVLPWDPLYRKSAHELLARFCRERSRKKGGDQDVILLEDQIRAHEKALSSSEDLGLSGLLVLSKDRVLGIGWFAVLPDRRGAIQFLEAREPGLTGISVLLTQHFFALFPGISVLNIQGDVQNQGIRLAKKLDLPCRLSPVYRITLAVSSGNTPAFSEQRPLSPKSG